MIGIYLLVTVIAQLSSYDVSVFLPALFPGVPVASVQSQNREIPTAADELLRDSSAAEIAVQFNKANVISVGAPVVAEGELIGAVSSISSIENKAEQKLNKESCEVKVKIAPRHRELIRRGTVALIASPVSTARVRLETVIELLLPRSHDAPALREGDSIVGYSSYEDYWSAPSVKSKPA